MLRLTLAQMRRSLGRLAAAGLAILIGAAFVAATLLSGTVITRTTYDAAAGQYGDADLVITQAELDEAGVAAIRALPGVEAVHITDAVGLELSGPAGRDYLQVQARPDDPRLDGTELTEGALPARPGEIALPADLASRLEVELGGAAEAIVWEWRSDEPVEHRVPLTVVGLLTTGSAFLAQGGIGMVDPTQWLDWYTATNGGEQIPYWEATVALAPDTSASAAIDAITPLVGAGGQVLTRDQKAAQIAAELAGSTWVLTGVVLSFAAVSLLVASLVIANTFQVLVAQRTRTLALLRCVGAERSQLRRSVLLEAGLVGVVSSAVGVLAGVGLVQLALTVLGRATDVPLPETVTMSWQVVVVPLLLGSAVTVLASLAPARAATRVSPLEALRPADPVHGGAGRARAWTSAVLVAGGAALLALGWVVSSAVSMPIGLLVGVLGGGVSFVGVMIGAVFWVPGLLARAGRLLSRSAAGRLAAANAVRNPRRVATTSGALFIGVTLVAMMSTGAASVTRTFTAELASQYPVDVVVETLPETDGYPELPATLADQLTEVDGVADAVPVTVTDTVTAGGLGLFPIYGTDGDQLGRVLADPSMADPLDDKTVLLTAYDAAQLGLAVGDPVTLDGPDGAVDLTVGSISAPVTLATTASIARLDASASAAGLWIRLDDGVDAAATVGDLQGLAAKADGALVQVIGLAVERAFFQRVVDTLLAVVVGLLGVAVVIAVVGVANTLSLSVLERRRESATLRAIGMTRGQLRGSLAVEGLMVALVGTVVGALLGVGYGFIGAHVLLAEVSAVQLAVPWRDLALVLLVAVTAGLLASVLPARSATRTPPVEALGAE